MQKICKRCEEKFDTLDKPKGWMANHSRWCHANPKGKDYRESLTNARAAKTAEGTASQGQKIKVLYQQGRYDHVKRQSFLGKKHTDETKQKMREKALASNHIFPQYSPRRPV